MEGKKKFFTAKKFTAFAVIIAIIVGGTVLGPKIFKPKPVFVDTKKVEATDLQELVTVKGELQGAEEANVQPVQVAEIKAIYVKEGDRVTKGQLLAILDADDTGNQRAKVNQQIAEATRKMNDAKILYEAGALPQNDYLEAKAALEAAKLGLGDLKEAKNRITAPISGIVTRMNATVGSSSSNNGKDPLFVIENLDNLRLKVSISEFEIGKINVGQSVTIKAQTLGEKTETGTVFKISKSGEQRQDSQEKIVPVEIKVTNNSGKLIAGTRAKAEILIKDGKGVKSVPVEAIYNDGDKNYVYKLSKGKVEKIEVDLGIEGTLRTEIKSDKFKVGDKVIIVNPDNPVEDGQEVIEKPEGEK